MRKNCMQFIDETYILIEAGTGGTGCLSFSSLLRGSDGGNGGTGGNIFCIGDKYLNTLFFLNYNKVYKAQNGENGKPKKQNGNKGKDVFIKVPVGSMLRDAQTCELIGEIIIHRQNIKVAKGGTSGIGNLKTKRSKNMKGTIGESRNLYIELILLADVGCLGIPNSGKSTLIRSITSALPKVARYPFTTLRPFLGFVKLNKTYSFIITDVPGLIIGASQGLGLGLKFIKHLNRIKIICNLLDVMCNKVLDTTLGIISEIKTIYIDMFQKKRYLVLNKLDKLPKYKKSQVIEIVINGLTWRNKTTLFIISAKKKYGCYELKKSALTYLKRGING